MLVPYYLLKSAPSSITLELFATVFTFVVLYIPSPATLLYGLFSTVWALFLDMIVIISYTSFTG